MHNAYHQKNIGSMNVTGGGGRIIAFTTPSSFMRSRGFLVK